MNFKPNMSTRRVERVILGAGLKFSSIQSLKFVVAPSNRIMSFVLSHTYIFFSDFFFQFLPDIRFNNPTFKFDRRVPEGSEPEHIVVDFGDYGTHKINLALYPSSHYIAQRLSLMDAELFDTFR